MPDIVPPHGLTQEDEKDTERVQVSIKSAPNPRSHDLEKSSSIQARRGNRKPKGMTNKQRSKIQRGIEISDKLESKTSKRQTKKDKRQAAKKVYD